MHVDKGAPENDNSDNVHGKLRMIHRKISKERRKRERHKPGRNGPSSTRVISARTNIKPMERVLRNGGGSGVPEDEGFGWRSGKEVGYHEDSRSSVSPSSFEINKCGSKGGLACLFFEIRE